MNYQNTIERIAEKLIENTSYKYQNTVIVGNNSAGKSDLLNRILEKKADDIYFIDAINRKVNTGIITDNTKNIHWREVIEERKNKANFNQRDTFGNGSITIESVLYKYQEKIGHIFYEFTKKKFTIVRQTNGFVDDYIVRIDDNVIDGIENRLSNGYQALIRIFAELIFYEDDAGEGKKLILIEEIDKFLALEFQNRILEFLIMYFPAFHFVVSTHSIHVVAGTSNCNIIVLGKGQYELYDSNDFDSIALADNIFERLETLDTETDSMEERLKILLNHKIQSSWSVAEDEIWNNIKIEDLTPIELLLYRTIKGWNYE